ncbi:MAG: hypothetical protein AAF288_05020 [Planctomycetota bacterium]
MPVPHAPSRCPRAFTLLELILVGVIVALMAGLALPRLSGWSERARLQDAANQLDATLVQAAVRARQDVRAYVVVIDPSRRAYALRPADQFDLPDADWAGPFTLPDDVQIWAAVGGVTATEAWIDFQPDGLGAPASVVLASGRHAVALVRAAPADAFERFSVTEPSDE